MVVSPDRIWSKEIGASAEEIQEFEDALPFDLPRQYLDLLRFTNGGEGELALMPLWFQLFPISGALGRWRNEFFRKEFPTLFFFGTNGGLESIAFEIHQSRPWPIIAVDCIAGMSSAEVIAPDIVAFISAIGNKAS